MLLLFTAEQTRYLSAFSKLELSDDVLTAFAALVEQHICNVGEEQTEALRSFSEENEIQLATLRLLLEAFVFTLTEAIKYNLSAEDYEQSLKPVVHVDVLITALQNIYESNKERIRNLFISKRLKVPQFNDLRWRMEVAIASRANPIGSDIVPYFLLELETQAPKDKQIRVLQCDLPNMKHLTDELERALQEAQSAHARRMQRLFNNKVQ
ncbi:MAG: hypothetical protein EZS28_039508 [Streblomastix strix]|uniref:COMM domain-containing protein n=2 Tax=Streblomastix strix TaxID=222440 RepID=A0A5J4U3K4_9EUKA|nr:MAG: hypothetical protein EZS28_039508 [Streblomastix strix]